MFDKIVNIQRPFYETGDLRNLNVTVNEHRAPTDDSIRLAREMEEKVREQFEKGVRLEINGLKTYYYKYNSMMGFNHCFIFDLNGKREKIEFVIDPWVKEEVVKEIVTKFSERFSCLILENMSKEDEKCLFQKY